KLGEHLRRANGATPDGYDRIPTGQPGVNATATMCPPPQATPDDTPSDRYGTLSTSANTTGRDICRPRRPTQPFHLPYLWRTHEPLTPPTRPHIRPVAPKSQGDHIEALRMLVNVVPR